MAKRTPGWSLTATPEQLLEAMGLGEQDVHRALRAAAETFRTEWVLELSGPGRGKLYEAGLRFITAGGRVIPIRDKSGVRRVRATHRASAPGDSPARDSGGSANSIVVDASNPDALRIGSNRRSLRHLHYGVKNHPGAITILPRPHATRAYSRARELMTDRFNRELRRGHR